VLSAFLDVLVFSLFFCAYAAQMLFPRHDAVLLNNSIPNLGEPD
jgi:hypothetical protein